MSSKMLLLAAAMPLSVLCLIAETAAEAPLDFLFKEDGTYAPFETKPAKELMTAAELAEYQSSLRDLECDAAALDLNKAFVRAYPQFARALKKEGVKYDRNYSAWTGYAFSRFHEFGFCVLICHLQEIEKEITALAISPPKYVFREFGQTIENDHPPVRSRDLSIRSLVRLAHEGHTPALVKIAEFVRRGDLFDVGANVEFYLLTRACHLGHDCTAIDARLNELAALLPAGRREAVANKARAPEAFVRHVFHRGYEL